MPLNPGSTDELPRVLRLHGRAWKLQLHQDRALQKGSEAELGCLVGRFDRAFRRNGQAWQPEEDTVKRFAGIIAAEILTSKSLLRETKLGFDRKRMPDKSICIAYPALEKSWKNAQKLQTTNENRFLQRAKNGDRRHERPVCSTFQLRSDLSFLQPLS